MARRGTYVVRPAANEAEGRAFVDVARQSFADFGRPPEFGEKFLKHVGWQNLRLVMRGKRVLGGLGILRFGHWFGGCSIPTVGITCVAMLPETRGSGLGEQLMRDVLKEIHAEGFPLSTLYPSTVSFYRKVGYEPAGDRVTWALDVNRIGVRERTRTIRPMTEKDRKAVYALHCEFGRLNPGIVDRTPLDWERVFDLATEQVFSYVVEAPRGKRGIEGYVAFTQKHHGGMHTFDIMVRDLAFRTSAAGRRLLSFFADHGTLAGKVMYDGIYPDPLTTLIPNELVDVSASIPLMLRVVDLAKALRQRGYPAGVRAKLHLQVRDKLFRHNNGPFVLTVDDGVGRVRKGGRGRLKLDIRGLAPLFSGRMSPQQLALADLLDGSEADLAQAAAIFAGPRPWCNERF